MLSFSWLTLYFNFCVFFSKCCLINQKESKIELPTYSVPQFELRDTTADIQWRREERKAREREEEAQNQREEETRREEARIEERARTEKSDTETEAGGEEGTSQS